MAVDAPTQKLRADDLREGGVSDCWFMSALAVVAEGHDLIAKLFSAGA